MTYFSHYSAHMLRLHDNTDDKPLKNGELKESENLENENKCKSTESQTKHYLTIFLTFLKENKLPNNVKSVPLRYQDA